MSVKRTSFLQLLYPSRVPYEESSTYSGLNFQALTANSAEQLSALGRTTPHLVELQPGEVLYVPRHWWHAVAHTTFAIRYLLTVLFTFRGIYYICNPIISPPPLQGIFFSPVGTGIEDRREYTRFEPLDVFLDYFLTIFPFFFIIPSPPLNIIFCKISTI